MLRIVTDLHIHSKYAQAVSKYMDLFEIARMADIKGIDIISTGDWQHPIWNKELNDTLEEVNTGIYKIKGTQYKARFMLTTEVACMYWENGKYKRIHFLIFSPSFECCDKVIKEFNKLKIDLTTDGRAILLIPSIDLLKLCLDIDENILIIPAHAWTPWFGIYGSRSGYNSIEECFKEYSQYIYAIETGLSSDPLMNWGIRELENRTILSFSDAHSSIKIGRESTIFKSKESIENLTYNDFASYIKGINSRIDLDYTIEYYPEEGKYHWSGHRKCDVIYTPHDIEEKGNICPVCKRKLTEGVEIRVDNLKDKREQKIEEEVDGITFIKSKNQKRKPFISWIPLNEILIKVYNSPTKGLREYERLTKIHNELDILFKLSLTEIEELGGKALRTALNKVRKREVSINPGYDGVFGKVEIEV